MLLKVVVAVLLIFVIKVVKISGLQKIIKAHISEPLSIKNQTIIKHPRRMLSHHAKHYPTLQAPPLPKHEQELLN